MSGWMNWKAGAAAAVALLVFGAGLAVGANRFGQPKSIIHIVSVKWKSDATEVQKRAALEGVQKMAGQIPGIKNVWLKQTRTQQWGTAPEAKYDASWVIEFENREAERAYEKSAARTEWFEKVYNPIREQSRSNQYTN